MFYSPVDVFHPWRTQASPSLGLKYLKCTTGVIPHLYSLVLISPCPNRASIDFFTSVDAKRGDEAEESPLTCAKCDQKAVQYCKECSAVFCDMCSELHSLKAAFVDHTLVPAEGNAPKVDARTQQGSKAHLYKPPEIGETSIPVPENPENAPGWALVRTPWGTKKVRSPIPVYVRCDGGHVRDLLLEILLPKATAVMSTSRAHALSSSQFVDVQMRMHSQKWIANIPVACPLSLRGLAGARFC